MKVGLFITNQQTLDTDMVNALDDQFAMVRLARDCGWDSLFSGQHYLNEGNNKQLQTVPLLARLAAEAGEMTIGLGILLLNLHNPVYTAETVATLDIIARGNFIFGVGLGYRDIEFDAFGVPKGERVKRLEEYLTLVERLWTEDRVSYEGPGCRLDNVHMNIRPVQKPRPPIWMAANTDPAVKRAARRGCLVHQPARHQRHHPPANGGLPRGAGGRRKGRAAGVAGRQGGLLRQGSGDRTRNGRTLPAGEIPGLCQVGAGQSHARRHRLQSPARRVDQAAVHPWLARGLLRRAQALLGRVRRQSHHHPHALGGDAIIHLTREHASDLGRATPCAAGSLARRPAWLRASLSILAAAA